MIAADAHCKVDGLDRVYVAGQYNMVYVVDGATHSCESMNLTTGSFHAVAVNPVTNRIYVANYVSSSVTVPAPSSWKP